MEPLDDRVDHVRGGSAERLTDIHPRALAASTAAEAAGMQGHFWDMHALLQEVTVS